MRRPVVLSVALVLGGAGAVVSAAPVGAAIASVHHACATSGRLSLAGTAFSYPRLNLAASILLGLALIGASAIAVGLSAALRQRRAYLRFLGRLDVTGSLSGYPTVQVIADPRPLAFCAGYLRPRVYVSQAALHLLSAAELDAVLAHEHHHRRVRDPLRLACGRILSHALFFVPALRSLVGRYADLAELYADDAAVRGAPGGRAALASALLAFDASGAGISPERVDSLLGQAVVWRRPWWLMSASIASLASLAAATWEASQAASAQATLNVPFMSSRPCLAILTLIPLLGCATILRRRKAGAPGVTRAGSSRRLAANGRTRPSAAGRGR